MCTALLSQLPCILEHLHNLKVGGNLAQNSLSAGSLPNSFYPVGLSCSSAPPPMVSTTLVQSPWYFSMDARGCGGSEPRVCWAGLQSAARGPGLPSYPALPATVLGAAVLGCWGAGGRGFLREHMFRRGRTTGRQARMVPWSMGTAVIRSTAPRGVCPPHPRPIASSDEGAGVGGTARALAE